MLAQGANSKAPWFLGAATQVGLYPSWPEEHAEPPFILGTTNLPPAELQSSIAKYQTLPCINLTDSVQQSRQFDQSKGF